MTTKKHDGTWALFNTRRCKHDGRQKHWQHPATWPQRVSYSFLIFSSELGKAVPTTGLQGATHANNKENRTEFYSKTSQRGISVDWSVYFFWHLFLQLLFKRKSEKKVTWIWVLTKRSGSGKRLIPRLSMLKDDALDAILQRFTIVTRKLGRV